MSPKIYIPLLVIIFAMIIFFSRKFVSEEVKTITFDTAVAQRDKDKIQETFLYLPSPYEIISYIQKEQLSFDRKLLNPIANKEKYVISIDKKINIGIYSADVAYLVFFRKKQDVAEYLKKIDEMCREEAFPPVLDEDLKNNITRDNLNTDTLSKISNEIYRRTIDNMIESGQKNSYGFLLSGALVETLYLIINSGHKDKSYIKKRIAEQKLLFEDLFMLLETLKKNKNVGERIDDMKGLKNAFAKIHIKTNKLKLAQVKGNTYDLSGENVIEYTDEAYNTLNKEITNLRKLWIEK